MFIRNINFALQTMKAFCENIRKLSGAVFKQTEIYIHVKTYVNGFRMQDVLSFDLYNYNRFVSTMYVFRLKI